MTTLLETSLLAAKVPLALHATFPGLYLSPAWAGLHATLPLPPPIVQTLPACLSVCCPTFELFTFFFDSWLVFVTAPHSRHSFLLDCGLTRLHIYIICDGDEHPLTTITLRPKHEFVAGSRRFVPSTCFLLSLPLRLILRPCRGRRSLTFTSLTRRRRSSPPPLPMRGYPSVSQH